MPLSNQQLTDYAAQLTKLRDFPRDPRTAAEVAIMLGELCNTPTEAEAALDSAARAERWPGIERFRRLAHAVVSDLRTPPATPTAASTPQPVTLLWHGQPITPEELRDKRLDEIDRQTYERLASDPALFADLQSQALIVAENWQRENPRSNAYKDPQHRAKNLRLGVLAAWERAGRPEPRADFTPAAKPPPRQPPPPKNYLSGKAPMRRPGRPADSESE